MSQLEQIFDSIKSAEAASMGRNQWQPEQQGKIDIRIASDGAWYHEGRRFQRDSLVKLFAGVLRREADEYFLVTPVEKLRIEVDDAPFVANLVEQIEDQGQRAIVFTTNIGEPVVLDSGHPLRIEQHPETGEPRPYVYFRDGLEALITRSAFYDLINFAEEVTRDGVTMLVVTSLGQQFELGSSR